MRRYLLIITGLFFVALGGIGVVVPGLPTVVFLLLAAGCFAKSCPALHRWLLDNKVFGPMIYHWQVHRAIPRRSRKIALLTIMIVALFSLTMLQPLYLKLLVAALLVIPVVILLRLKVADEGEGDAKPEPKSTPTRSVK